MVEILVQELLSGGSSLASSRSFFPGNRFAEMLRGMHTSLAALAMSEKAAGADIVLDEM